MDDPIEITPFFLPLMRERLFCIYLAPKSGKPSAGILYLHPFAEEMHKARHMAAMQARRFAEQGLAVLMVDLLGCGDSTGDFADADWQNWKQCAKAGMEWLTKNTDSSVFLWGLRMGATLAADLSTKTPNLAGLILWQPITNGENFLTQFLRIRVASEILTSKQTKVGVDELKRCLSAGKAIEVGGYMLNPRLAETMARIRLIEMPISIPVYWFEIAGRQDSGLPPASASAIEAWKKAGVSVQTCQVQGEPFWTASEIQECPALISATTDALSRMLA